MRTSVNLDDRLLEEARRITGLEERKALLDEGLRAVIERESARRLARLGGSEPDLTSIRRRRHEAERSSSTRRSGSITFVRANRSWPTSRAIGTTWRDVATWMPVRDVRGAVRVVS